MIPDSDDAEDEEGDNNERSQFHGSALLALLALSTFAHALLDNRTRDALRLDGSENRCPGVLQLH